MKANCRYDTCHKYSEYCIHSVTSMYIKLGDLGPEPERKVNRFTTR